MKNNITTAARAVLAALCFLTVFFCCAVEVCAESGQLTHRHTGSRENGGGCYGALRSQTWDCHSYNVSVGFNGTDYIYVCGQCGTRWSGPGKADEPRCSGTGTTTFYEVNCGKEGAAAVSFSCEKSTQEWAKEIDLNASYSVHEGGVSVSGFLWNGSPGGAGFHVTENGTYTLRLTGSGNVDFSPAVSVTVDRIDNTPPAIGSFQASSDTWGTSVELAAAASDAESGLAAEAYSFDGGASWSSSNTYTVTENGTYSVRVRDAAGNISMAETSVNQIDTTPPNVSVSTDPSVDNWYDGSLTVTVQAQDGGGGLADAPYSFDGGATYLVGNSAVLSGSGTIEIAVKDLAGNVTRMSFRAEKKQRPQPTPAPNGGSGGGGNSGNGSGTGNNGNGTGNGRGKEVTGTGNLGNSGNGGTGTGDGASGKGNGTGTQDAAGSGSGGSGNNGVETGVNVGSGTGNNGNGTGNGRGAGVSGISGGSGNTGRGQNPQGSQDAGGKGRGTGVNGGTSNGAGTGSGTGGGNGKGGNGSRYGSNSNTQAEGTLPQHYPGGLPRIGDMQSGRRNGSGSESLGGIDRADGRSITDSTGMMDGNDSIYGDGRTDGNDGAGADSGADRNDGAGAGGADSMNGSGGYTEGTAGEENAIVQNELLAPADGQEAAILQRTGGNGDAWAGVRYGGAPAVAVGAAMFAAAVLCGWALLFGIRVDTRDEKGQYRFAGITCVTRREQERLRVVPLTKQIIRNSHTNELRFRFGLLSRRRYEGETLLLRYRSIKREFKAQRTVELHIRA